MWLLRFLFIILFPALAWAQTPALTWTDDTHSAVHVALPDYDSSVQECVDSGLVVRVRFELELCRSRNYWFDKCNSVVVSEKEISFDAVGEQYRIKFDVFGDGQVAQESQFTSREGAISDVTQIARVKLISLSRGRQVALDRSRINVRVSSECVSTLTDNMSRVSQLLSLGVIEIHRYNSGWISFPLDAK